MAFRNSIASSLPKFRGDNIQNINTWLQQFDAHCVMTEIRPPRKLPALLCCLEDTAFAEITQLMADDEDITYEEVRNILVTKFSGADYRRKLQVKLQSLLFTKGTNINSFVHELTTTIQCLYNLTDMEVIRQIAMNHITSNLDESLRADAKIF